MRKAGGLYVVGTERHESRRIDNQLRGRSGRQGDPGASRFYLSLDDSLMRIFAGDRVRAIMDRLKMPEGEAIEAGIVTRSIESAQRKVEGHNFDMRKQLLEYDDVSNDQRKVIYQQRNEILDSADMALQIKGLRQSCMTDLVRQFVPVDSVEEQWDLAALERVLAAEWGLELGLSHLYAKSVDTRIALLYSDFKFVHHPVYGNNALPGFAPLLWRGEVLYRWGSEVQGKPSLYAGPKFEWVPRKAPMDSANTLDNPGYALLGFKAGQSINAQWSWFVDARNMTNRTYAATTNIAANYTAVPGDGRRYYPGDGRSVYLGVEAKLAR